MKRVTSGICAERVKRDDRLADKASVVLCLLSGAKLTREVEEREALILELQDVITELHQEMSLKEQHELQQLQQLLQLEAKVKELQEQVQGSEGTKAQLRLELAERAESNSAMLNVVSTLKSKRLFMSVCSHLSHS
ncbi:hypothetical protein QQF64_029629 [Cirrhinus molitorella]|uniref:Uncharacterized protein n=1 Tax=Cirrhinus molitorella TaxID=172907 RepID=A0ABR3N158_9TELE